MERFNGEVYWLGTRCSLAIAWDLACALAALDGRDDLEGIESRC